MKYLLSFIFVISATLCISQKNTLQLSKASLTDSAALIKLLPGLPQNCKGMTFEMLGSVNGQSYKESGRNKDFSGRLFRLAKLADLNRYLYLDILAECDQMIVKYYKILVVK